MDRCPGLLAVHLSRTRLQSLVLFACCFLHSHKLPFQIAHLNLLSSAMGLLAPTASTGLACMSKPGFHFSQIYRYGLTGSCVHLKLDLENIQLASRGYVIHTRSARSKRVWIYRMTVAQASQQVFSVALEGLKSAENANVNPVLKDSGQVSLIQFELSKLSSLQLEMEDFPSEMQKVPYLVEDLNQPSSSAAIESQAATGEGTSLIDAIPDAIPASPYTSLTDQDSALESIRSSAPSVNNGIDSAQEAANSAKDSILSSESKSVIEAYEALLSGERSSMESDSAVDAISQASKSVSDAFEETKSVLANTISEVQDSLQNSINDAVSAVKSTYDNINGSLVDSFKNISDLSGKSLNVVESGDGKASSFSQESPLDLLTSSFRMGTPVNNLLKGVITTVESAIVYTSVAMGKLIVTGYTSTKGILPVDVQLYLDATEKKLSEFAGPIEFALKQVYAIIPDAERALGIDPENAVIPVIIAIGGSIFLGALYWQSTYGGYSGDLAPASALDLLTKDGNIVLVDIRPEALQEIEGIPDLRRQARFKVANVEAIKVQGSIQKFLKNVDDTDAVINATIIKNLKCVERNTKVIVMDAEGSQSKRLARALKRVGIKMPYRIEGGFQAWIADGLRVKKIGQETPLSIIKEETEAILEEIKPTPGGLAAVTLGTFAGIYALIEWEKTLQLLGLICIIQVVFSRFNSYESVDDIKADLRILLRPFALASQGIVWVAGKVEPSKLQLATSPSTSAVQDRVLQAAAKHGPLPSELDQQQEGQPLEVAASEGIDTSTQ